MRRANILAVVLALASLWLVLGSALAAVWLTDEVRVIGLVLLPTVVVAALLVVYFDWRARLQHRVLADRGDSTAWNEAA